MSSPEPEVFGEYLLVQRLAQSPLAEAVVAVRLGDRSGRTYVIKRPRLGERASGAAAQAIRREAEVLQAVRSPHLVALEEVGTVAGLPFVALEHVRGVPLDRLLSEAGALPPEHVRAIARDVLLALGALHAAGWVHGDVAPSNVVVDDTGEARLLDLGIAARAGERRAVPAGKPGYVAPEAMGERPVSPAEDVYALGVVIAECSLGRRIFLERDLSEAATREGPPPTVCRLEPWGPLLERALALDAERRPELAELTAAADTGQVDRAGLAETVERVRNLPERTSSRLPAAPKPSAGSSAPRVGVPALPATVRELTPTAPAAEVAMKPSEPATAPPPAAARPRRDLLAILLAGGASGALGWLLGRRSGARSNRGASLGLSAALPARARLAIDDRVIAPPEPGKEIPVEPGRHTISITLPRREAQVFDVVVGPGEHVVLMLQLGGTARGARGGGTERDPEAGP